MKHPGPAASRSTTPAIEKHPSPRKRLTERQKAFCREYLVDYNATRAAIQAGYATTGARQEGSRLLAKADIQKELAHLVKPIREAAELRAADVLELAMAVAGGDIRTLFTADEDGETCPKDMHDLSGTEQRLVAGWKRKPDGSVEIKFADRDKAVERLMKHYGLLKEHVQLETTSELTPAEQERMHNFTDEELAEFTAAEETIHRLLYPGEASDI